MKENTAVLIVLLLAVSAAASDTAGLTVHVAYEDDSDGDTTATVSLLTQGKTVVSRSVASGPVTFDNLPAGHYQIRISSPAFATWEQKAFLMAGKEKVVHAKLQFVSFSGAVTVSTANRRIEMLDNVAEPVTVIDAKEIEDSGSRTAKDLLLEYAGSGLFVDAGGGQGNVSINGIPNKGVLILVDGRRWLGKNALGEVNLEDLDISRFERVEVVKGAGSALYGSEALGGVINFISRKPAGNAVENTVDLSYGSYDEIRAANSVSARGDFWSASASIAYRGTNGYDLDPDNPQTIGQPESDIYTAGGNGSVYISDRLTANLLAEFSRKDVDKLFFSGATQLDEDVYNSQRQIERTLFSPELVYSIADTTSITLQYTYGNYWRDETRIYPDRTEDIQPWREWNQSVEAHLEHTYSLAGMASNLQTGYEFRNEQMDRENLVFPGETGTRTERDINVFWAQHGIDLWDNLTLNVGFRYDDYSDFGDEVSPKISAVWSPLPEHRLRASYGHGFRAPSFGELYLDLGFFFVGNPDLKPESSESYSIGYSYLSDAVVASFDLFRNDVENGITFDFSGFPFSPITFTNQESFTSEGINASLSLNLPFSLNLNTDYTFVGGDNVQGDHLGIIPRHALSSRVIWTHKQSNTRANLRMAWQDEVVFADGTFQPDYAVWDARVSTELGVFQGTPVSGFIQVDNIFDNSDIFLRTSDDMPIPGQFQIWLPPRTFLIGVQVNFGIN